jgi:hypothetical protein
MQRCGENTDKEGNDLQNNRCCRSDCICTYSEEDMLSMVETGADGRIMEGKLQGMRSWAHERRHRRHLIGRHDPSLPAPPADGRDTVHESKGEPAPAGDSFPEDDDPNERPDLAGPPADPLARHEREQLLQHDRDRLREEEDPGPVSLDEGQGGPGAEVGRRVRDPFLCEEREPGRRRFGIRSRRGES